MRKAFFFATLSLLIALTGYGFPVNTNLATLDPNDVQGDYSEFRWEWGGYEDQFIQVDFKDVVVTNIGFRMSYPLRGNVFVQKTDFTVTQTTIVTEVLEIFTNTYPKVVGTNHYLAWSNVTITRNNFVDYYTNSSFLTTSTVVDSSAVASNIYFTNSVATSIVFTGTGTFTTVPAYGIYTNVWQPSTSTITYVTNDIFINALGSNFVENSDFNLSVTNWILGTNVAYASDISGGSVTTLSVGASGGTVYQGFTGLSVGETYRYYVFVGTFDPTYPSEVTINMAGNITTNSTIGYVVLTNTALDASGIQVTLLNTNTTAYVDDIYVQPFKAAVTNSSQGINSNALGASNVVVTLFPEDIHTNKNYSISSQAVTRATIQIDRTNVPPVNTYFAEFLGYEGSTTNIPTRILSQGKIPVFRSIYQGTNIVAWMNPSNVIGPPYHTLTDPSAWPFNTNMSTGADTSSWDIALQIDGTANTPATNTESLWSQTYYDLSNTNTFTNSIALGGDNNSVTAPNSTIGGGSGNIISGPGGSTIGGGVDSWITGAWATIPGGRENQAHGNYSSAGGRLAIANHTGSMVLGDGTTNSKTSSGNNALDLYFDGGVNVKNGPLSADGSSLTNIPLGGVVSTGSAGQMAFSDGSGSWYEEDDPSAYTNEFEGGSSTGSVKGSGSTSTNVFLAEDGTWQTVNNTEGAGGGSGVYTNGSGVGTILPVGSLNIAAGNYGVVAGGTNNVVSNDFSVVSGGSDNVADTAYATVAGGRQNSAIGFYPSVGGGWQNTATSDYSTVGGGRENSAGVSYSTVGGGRSNAVNKALGSVLGGAGNTVDGLYGAIPGGFNNTASGTSTFAAGQSAQAVHDNSFVFSDGSANATSKGPNTVTFYADSIWLKDTDLTTGGASIFTDGAGTNSIVSTNVGMVASAGNSAALGGTHNEATNTHAIVAGGHSNSAGGLQSFVGGGRHNFARSGSDFIGGGEQNETREHANGGQTISGGVRNWTQGRSATVGGGEDHEASGNYSTVGGGDANRATATGSTVAGGDRGLASGGDSFVGGGQQATASGNKAGTVAGEFAVAGGNYSFVGGSYYGDIAPDSTGAGIVGGTQGYLTGSYYTFLGAGHSLAGTNAPYGALFGFQNKAHDATNAFTGAGSYNLHIGGTDSSISGGLSNTMDASQAWLGGQEGLVTDDHVWLWAGTGSAVSSDVPSEAVFAVTNGVRILITTEADLRPSGSLGYAVQVFYTNSDGYVSGVLWPNGKITTNSVQP